MSDHLPEATRRFVELAGPEPSAVQREMETYASEEGFPIIGREVGGLLRIMARMVDARHVAELGSGFGYSASWLAGALPDDGHILLTEYDADELEMAREFAARAGWADRATFEHGDAIEIVEGYDGPFDVVLMDQEKRRYVEGFEAVRAKVAAGGMVIADNMMHGPLEFDDVLSGLEGGSVEGESARGVVDYLGHMRDDPAFETTVVPLGSGIAVSVRHG